MPKKKVKWSFIVESDAKNMQELDAKFMTNEGCVWEIPHDSVIGISRLEPN